MTGREPVTVRVPLEKMEKLPELRVRNFHTCIYGTSHGFLFSNVSF
jgi:hypothetical protein